MQRIDRVHGVKKEYLDHNEKYKQGQINNAIQSLGELQKQNTLGIMTTKDSKGN